MKQSSILWYNSSTGESQVWYMDGHRLVDRGTVLGLDGNPVFIGPPFGIVGAGDANADGKADIVWYNSATGETQLWYMDGHQLVDRGTVLGLDGNPVFIGPPFSIVAVGDMNADGKADIVWYNSATGETQVWYMDGHQLVDRGTVLGLDGNPVFIGPPFSIVAVGDMNGNGKADIVWYNSATGETQVWYMDGHQLVDRGTVLGLDGNPVFIGPPFSIAGAGDMNGDGKADIVWYNNATGEIQVWYMDGHQLVDRGVVLDLDGNPAFIGPPFSIVATGDFGHGVFSRCNRLHIKVLTSPTNTSIETMLDRMREVYSNAGIRVDVVSREVLTPAILGTQNFTDLNDLDVRACQRGTASSEQRRLFQNQNHVAPGERGHEVVVYFVRSVTASRGSSAGALNGCASHPSGQPGACIGQGASQWTLAHEVGHVLGLEHISGEHVGCPSATPQCCSTRDRTRLMTGCGTAGIVGVPTVDRGEISTMTNSTVTRPC